MKTRNTLFLGAIATMLLAACASTPNSNNSSAQDSSSDTPANVFKISRSFTDEDPAHEFEPALVSSQSIDYMETSLKLDGSNYQLTKILHSREQDQADAINKDLPFTNYKIYFEFTYSGSFVADGADYKLAAPTSGTRLAYYEQDVHTLYPARFPISATVILPSDRDWSKVETNPAALTENQFEYSYFGNTWVEQGSEYRDQIVKVNGNAIVSIAADPASKAIDVKPQDEGQEQGGEEEPDTFEDLILELHRDTNDCHLYLRENGVMTFKYSNMVTEEGTYTYSKETGFAFTPKEGATCTCVLNDGVYTIKYTAAMGGGRLSDEWTLAKSEADKLFNPGLVLVSNNYSLTIKPNGTYAFVFSSFGINEQGKYSFVDNKIVFTPNSESSKAKVEVTYGEDGTVTIKYTAHTSDRIVATFTTSASSLEEFNVGGPLVLEAGSYKLTLALDKTYTFEFPSFGVKEEGSYAFNDGKVVFTPSAAHANAKFEVTYAEDGAVTIKYTAHASERLVATFTTTASALSALNK